MNTMRTRRMRELAGALLAAGLALAGWQVRAQNPPAERAPSPLSRGALLKALAVDPKVREALTEQVRALGGNPGAVLAGTAAARPGEDVNDRWHQGLTLTPRDSQVHEAESPLGLLVVYNVFMHSLKDCLAGNYLPVASGPGPSPYAAAGLYEMPGEANTEHPWIVEVGMELSGLKEGDVSLQVNHEPVPAIRLGETGLVGFVKLPGGRHFVEITQSPPDPKKKTRRFWYTRAMRL